MNLLWSDSEAKCSRSASHAIGLEVFTNQKVAIQSQPSNVFPFQGAFDLFHLLIPKAWVVLQWYQ